MKDFRYLWFIAALIVPLYAAGYFYVRNAALEKQLHGFCSRVEAADQQALLQAAVTVLTDGKPYQYEEALANPELPYAMQEIEERLASLSSKNDYAVDLVYVRQVAQNFKALEKSCAAMLYKS